MAQCLGIAGEPAEAEEAYRVALAASPDDPATLQSAATYHLSTGHLREAEASLRRLAGLGDRSPVDAAWARRTLAMVMASGGDARRASEALSLLGPADGIEPAQSRGVRSVQDRRARAIVLAAQANRERRKEAIGLLEGILQEGSASADDRFMLAQLYESDGNWTKAREQMLALMASDGDDPKYVIYYTLNLLRRGQLGEAQSWVSRMERARPDSPSIVELKARVLHASGRKAEALALVAAFVRDKDAQVIPFAGVLEVMKEFGEAEKLLRQAAARGPKPQATFALIGFLGRRGRTKEAFELCDAAWSPATAGAVAQAYMQTMAVATTLDDADLERIAARFEGQIKARPDDFAIPLGLANLRTFQGKYAEAEAIYRSLADRDKTGAIPLNNLAWLLALQKGKEAEALPLIRRAIELQGESSNVLDTRAITFMALDRPGDAVRDLENAIVRGPTAIKYFHLARAYRMAGRRDEAGQALKKAKDLGLTLAEVHPLERPAYNDLVADLADLAKR
jgi:tetratricopeptide (TPR) repeat protein